MNLDTTLPTTNDPWELLGVAPEADEQTVRKAYLARIRAFPPERDPEAFERIRDAYEMARKPAMRLKSIMDGPDPNLPLAELLDQLPPQRAFTGPAPWMRYIKES